MSDSDNDLSELPDVPLLNRINKIKANKPSTSLHKTKNKAVTKKRTVRNKIIPVQTNKHIIVKTPLTTIETVQRITRSGTNTSSITILDVNVDNNMNDHHEPETSNQNESCIDLTKSYEENSIIDLTNIPSPVVNVTTKSRRGECPICMQPLGEQQVASTVCGHVFCFNCISDSIKYSNRCPTCRKQLNKSKIHPLYLP